jgi:glutamate--cysteine ligase
MITKKEHIIEYFHKGVKNLNEFKIGVEHEKFLFDLNSNKRADYPTILKMFKELFEFGWQPIMETDNIIGLTKDSKSITLEPGNQIELSGAKLDNIHQTCSESQDYLFELNQVISKLGLKIVSAGFDPISKIIEVPNNPKQRYEVMTNDMPKDGKLSLDMMYRTAGTQVNIDYSSEADFIKKFRIVNSIVPISIALFANSSIVERKKSPYLSYRSKVWQETSRGGLPESFFDNMDFERYTEYAMKLPMLFLVKDKKYISGKKYSFNDYMIGKIKELEKKFPTERDLASHLSTIFTENRLKQYIELRSMDACGWDCLCSGPAFNIGILYGNLDETFELVSKWDKSKIINAYLESPKKGFNTQLMGKDLLHWAALLLKISKKGLEDRDVIGKGEYNETNYLKHLEKIIDNKTTNADHMRNKFSKRENLIDLYDK